ncbi:P-loop containing nucleoside triphosphate hydrolase protein [Dentipellis sp. KUC8613]|nr:P-loop containing nucleoside triphosphate hydrolase protein [Dentipellis sp. KUC8613]
MSAPAALSPIIVHVRKHIQEPLPSRAARPPLFVAIQGPQGSGKTFLTEHAAAALSAGTPEHAPLRVATLSIDDLYLSHDGLVALAEAHPTNGLLHGRGQPGTHDIVLGLETLRRLKHINDADNNTRGPVKIPFFDKSKSNGEGDRVPEAEWTVVDGPLDVVLFEGWCVGFCPQSRTEIEQHIRETPAGLEGVFDMSKYRLEDVLEVNTLLADYIEWWDMFDLFVQIAPEQTSPYVHIYQWRLQQEHAMKAKNGGKGMSDEQVKAFVDRYIPGYHFFGHGIRVGGIDPRTETPVVPPWLQKDGKGNSSGNGKLLRVTIGEDRELVAAETQ